MPGQKRSKRRAIDAFVGAGIAAVVIMAATLGELGPARHATQAAAYGTIQSPAQHHALKGRRAHAKARCTGTAPC